MQALVVYYGIKDTFRPTITLSANCCPIFKAFLEPEIQSATHQLLPFPINQYLELTTPSEDFVNFWICSVIKWWSYFMLIASLQSKIDTSTSER